MMNRFVLVETCSGHEHGGVQEFLALALAMADAGRTVHLWLIQNGVLLLREQEVEAFQQIRRRSEILIHADELSLLQRSVELDSGESERICVAGMDELVRQIMAVRSKAIWH